MRDESCAVPANPSQQHCRMFLFYAPVSFSAPCFCWCWRAGYRLIASSSSRRESMARCMPRASLLSSCAGSKYPLFAIGIFLSFVDHDRLLILSFNRYGFGNCRVAAPRELSDQHEKERYKKYRKEGGCQHATKYACAN